MIDIDAYLAVLPEAKVCDNIFVVELNETVLNSMSNK